MGRTRAPRCLIKANSRVIASNSSNGTMGCFHMACSSKVCSVFVSPVGRPLAAEHIVGALLCLVHQCPALPDCSNNHDAYSQLCTVDTREKFDG